MYVDLKFSYITIYLKMLYNIKITFCLNCFFLVNGCFVRFKLLEFPAGKADESVQQLFVYSW